MRLFPPPISQTRSYSQLHHPKSCLRGCPTPQSPSPVRGAGQHLSKCGCRGRSALVSMDVVIQNHSRCKSARGAPLRALQHCCTRGEPQLPAHGAKSNRNQDPNKPKPRPQASEIHSLGAQKPQLTLPPAPSKAVHRLFFFFFLLTLVSKSITRPKQQLQGTGRMLGLLSGQGHGHRHPTRGARAPQPPPGSCHPTALTLFL